MSVIRPELAVTGRSLTIARVLAGGAVILKALILAPVLLGLAESSAVRLPMNSWLPALPGAAMIPILTPDSTSALLILSRPKSMWSTIQAHSRKA